VGVREKLLLPFHKYRHTATINRRSRPSIHTATTGMINPLTRHELFPLALSPFTTRPMIELFVHWIRDDRPITLVSVVLPQNFSSYSGVYLCPYGSLRAYLVPLPCHSPPHQILCFE
jgi:hypothetical protein